MRRIERAARSPARPCAAALSNPPFRGGFSAKGAEQNKQFIVNLMEWLAGILPQ
jgi:hypothetical protein